MLDATNNHTAFRQELLILVSLSPIAVWLGNGAVQIALLISVLIIILVVELINSAIETVVDRISEDEHELSRRAKDLGAAAVLASIINAGVVWGLALL